MLIALDVEAGGREEGGQARRPRVQVRHGLVHQSRRGAYEDDVRSPSPVSIVNQAPHAHMYCTFIILRISLMDAEYRLFADPSIKIPSRNLPVNGE